jgi:hypothetical protein
MSPSTVLAFIRSRLILLVWLLACGLGTALAQSEPTTDPRLEQLRSILDRPEFQAEEGRSALDALLDPIRTAIWSTVREFLRAILRRSETASGEDGSNLAGLVVALLVVVGATLLFVRLARGTLAAEAELENARPSGPPTADAERARAAAFAAAGDLRGALHHQYLAALRRLDERELLSYDGSLTNRELLPRARSRSGIAVPLDLLVETFDRLWYGQSACSAEEYRQFVELAERVWRAAGSGGIPQARSMPRWSQIGSSGPG